MPNKDMNGKSDALVKSLLFRQENPPEKQPDPVNVFLFDADKKASEGYIIYCGITQGSHHAVS